MLTNGGSKVMKWGGGAEGGNLGALPAPRSFQRPIGADLTSLCGCNREVQLAHCRAWSLSECCEEQGRLPRRDAAGQEWK